MTINSPSNFNSKTEKQRLFLITQDDPFFLPDELRLLFENFNVVGCVILDQKLHNDSFLKVFLRYKNVFGFFGFIKMGFLGAYNKLLLGRSVHRTLKQCKIPEFKTINVNSPEFIEQLRSLQLDILISVASVQKISNDVLALPKIISLNLHGGYLPDFPGVFTPFWNLLEGASYAGATVHVINSKIDGGDIAGRVQFPIEKDDSIYSLYRKISKNGIQLLIKVLNEYQNGKPNLIENKYDKARYHSFPTAKHQKQFQLKKLRVF